MGSIDTNSLLLATLLALLRKDSLGVNVRGQVMEGMREAKRLLMDSDLAALGGDTLAIPSIRSQFDLAAVSLQELIVQITADIIHNLPIDIKAQTIGNLSVNLAAQSVGNLAVSIAAQTLANLDMNLNAQNIGIYLQPDWAVKTGVDKTYYAVHAAAVPGEDIHVSHDVPVGKTFYIVYFSGSIYATNAADGDKSQHFLAYLKDATLDVTHASVGGSGGGLWPLPAPVAIPAGSTVDAYLYNETNHNCELRVVMAGYEI
jgi:hypothetical protein